MGDHVKHLCDTAARVSAPGRPVGDRIYSNFTSVSGAAALHSDKISHLTSTLLTCLQIIKHNIAYMSAVGAEYADVYFAT